MDTNILGVVGTLAGAALGTILGFGLERFRNWADNRKLQEEKAKSAKMLAKEFLRNELKLNDEQIRKLRYSMKINTPDESILTAIQKAYPNIGLEGLGKFFSIESWKLIRSKIIDLDEKTAIKINRLYYYYELLISFNGQAIDMSKVKLEDFKDYEKNYEILIEALNL